MKLTLEAFREWSFPCVTLLGMSGVGKTYLSHRLRQEDWFHYSGDYRIGTRYLDEPILDNIKLQAMQIPMLRELLRNDWIDIRNNIKITDLGPVSSFLGKLGNPEKGGLSFAEFSRRQALYREAEIAAMMDLPSFIHKAKFIYGYNQLVNDVGGSLCELEQPGVIELLAEHSLILYIRVPEERARYLIERAQADPKPLYYRPQFIREALADYLKETGLEYVAQIDPDEFVRWVFPRLFRSRIPRYEAICEQYGYQVDYDEVISVRDHQDFMALIERAIARSDRQ